MTPDPSTEFAAACLEVDRLIARLVELRADHFNVSPDAERNWADVAGVRLVAVRLRKALAHYGVTVD